MTTVNANDDDDDGEWHVSTCIIGNDDRSGDGAGTSLLLLSSSSSIRLSRGMALRRTVALTSSSC